MEATTEQLRELYRLADEYKAPPPGLYIPSKRSVVDDLVGDIRVAPDPVTKHLLYGSTGSGKSTQLRAVAASLSGEMTIVDIDFDASNITVAGISAFDLAYVIGVKTLGHLDPAEAQPYFDELAKAYAEGDEADASALGSLDHALPSIAGFGDAVIAIAKEAGAALLPGTAVVSAVKGAMHVLRLRTVRAGLVTETSPRGQRVQAALEKIFDAVRSRYGGRAIAVLLDGLEKVNGAANRWMRETFDYTRLLTNLSVTMIAATPACAFTETNSNFAAGWSPRMVYGFAPDDLATLTQVMYRRVAAAGLDLDDSGFGVAARRLAESSGGRPRDAMTMLRSAITNVFKAGRSHATADDIDAAEQRMREQLGMGVLEPGYRLLDQVDRTHQLPDNDVAVRLFSDGRILVHPPADGGPHTFHVHPLLRMWVAKVAADQLPASR